MSFYILNDIYQKLHKIYNKGDILKEYIEPKGLFPIVIKLKKVQQKDIQGNFSLLLKQIKNLKDSPFDVEYKQFDFKRLGMQTLPISIKINTIEEYCDIMDKVEVYERFIILYQKVIGKYPLLKEMIYKKPMLILEYTNEWDKLFLIIDYLVDKKAPNIYIRELVLDGIDTKFIESYKKIIDIFVSEIKGVESLKSIGEYEFEKKYNFKYPQSQVRFRILDDALKIAGLDDLTLNIDDFKNLKIECEKVFIVENKITFLSFPRCTNSIVIFGSGYSIGKLKDTTWLQDKKIYYWGDIDIDGFAILSQVRGYFSQTRSLCMDIKTADRFQDMAVSYKNKKFPELEHLTKDEDELYKRLIFDYYGESIRIEQEKIPFDYLQI